MLALVSIGLLASLLPRTSYVSQTSGELVDAIGPVWPDSAVEQAFGDVPGIISEVRIWAAAGFDRGEAPIVASLLQRRGDEPVRQVKVQIQASKLLRPYVLVFPPYQPVPGEDLILQLWVSTLRKNFVMFGVSEPSEDLETPAINRQSVDQGPLTHEVIWRGRGWRAALAGSKADLGRLAGALAAAAIAAVLQPSISRHLDKALGRVLTAFLAVFGLARRTLRRTQVGRAAQSLQAEAPSRRRGFYVFPWLIPAFAILHYLANNLLIFRLSEAIVVAVIAAAIATSVFLVFRLIFRTAAVAAVLTGLLGIAFFSYGHINVALGDHADDRYLFGLFAPTVLGLGALVLVLPERAQRIGLILNYASLVLAVLPAYQISRYNPCGGFTGDGPES